MENNLSQKNGICVINMLKKQETKHSLTLPNTVHKN